MKNKVLKLFIVLTITAMLFSACSKSRTTSQTGDSKEYTIVTSFYPMYISTLNVTKDIPNVKVVNMTEPQTGCLHDYQLSPADMKKLESASAFVINGLGMESFMENVTKQLPKLTVVEASKGIELLKNTTDNEENPHVWVSITDAIIQVNNISEQLAKADAENGEKYKRNAEEYIKKLEVQKAKMHKELEGIKNRDIVTFHEAFPYFAKEFNLNVAAIIEREPGSDPSSGELADTIKAIKDSKAKALFAEPQYSPKAAESIATQTGLKVYSLDPVATGPNTPDLDAYIKAMDSNLKSLVEALGK